MLLGEDGDAWLTVAERGGLTKAIAARAKQRAIWPETAADVQAVDRLVAQLRTVTDGNWRADEIEAFRARVAGLIVEGGADVTLIDSTVSSCTTSFVTRGVGRFRAQRAHG